MFELGKTARRVETLEKDTIPKLMGEMGQLNLSLERISSQVSKLIILVAVSGLVGSPDLVRGIIGSAYHLSEHYPGHEVRSIVVAEMEKSNEKGDDR
jgi:hypothetical protein